MKTTTVTILAVAALLSAAAVYSIPGAVSAEPLIIPSTGDGTGPALQRGSEKHIRATTAEATQLKDNAVADLHAGNYALAEMEARESLSLKDIGVSNEVLASALEAQGKDKEALQEYHVIVVDQKAGYPRVLLPYAQLLLKSGQWRQAVSVYNQALPNLPDASIHRQNPFIRDSELIAANSHFSGDVPEPAALATALHIARGMVYSTTISWSGDAQDTEAMSEYKKALQLAPDNALTNYFYGVGWQKLSPAERVKFGTAQQAKAALQKAVKIGNANVRKAAAKALESVG